METDRLWKMFINGFVGFFLAPAVVIVYLIFFAPHLVNYGNSGLVLLLSVLGGGLVGAFMGLIEPLRPLPALSDEIVWESDLWDREFDS